ncbi:hypothetical protein JQ612_09550 [Bradyrhizobium manausense]|uniref:hypothetical protein n=1 Tax=Bradyrhizobium manausense TaxID=989370 RepID=UPI001BAAB23D|nr:hypothetical protein [Bradyrhizobium manausense]MBR0686303.1 hypothetical protein [Bradyrhizobium manausense]MBR0722391.1 hypothetical protein [Bradyrhizobium manausense]MBR0833436.1 hypothetical protein [Bradyrhizobium manausense]
MTKTIIATALRVVLSLAIGGPAQAWPGQSSSIDCAWGSAPGECEALTMALVRKHALVHPHLRKAEHAVIPLVPTHQPDRDEDPLASMHFE